MSNFTEKLNKLEAKREAVEALLGLAEDERPNWFDEMPERQKYAMYKNYDTDKLIRQQELLYEEYNNLLRLMPAPAPGPVISQMPLPLTAPSVQQPNFPYLRRFYVLFNLQRPAEMLERGVRQYIVNEMKGRPIGGLIYRSQLPDYGQCIIIRASGTPDALESFENAVLCLKDEEGNIYWEYSKTYKVDETLGELIAYTFSIGQSTRGAESGRNSDPAYDNKSQRTSNTGASSKSGKGTSSKSGK